MGIGVVVGQWYPSDVAGMASVHAISRHDGWLNIGGVMKSNQGSIIAISHEECGISLVCFVFK